MSLLFLPHRTARVDGLLNATNSVSATFVQYIHIGRETLIRIRSNIGAPSYVREVNCRRERGISLKLHALTEPCFGRWNGVARGSTLH